MEISGASKRGIWHSSREEIPAVKAANVNSLLRLCAPRDFTEKLWESPFPEAAQRLMQGTRNGTHFSLCFSCSGCLGQAEHSALLQHPSVLEYKLTLPAAWLSVLWQNFMISELRCCAC